MSSYTVPALTQNIQKHLLQCQNQDLVILLDLNPVRYRKAVCRTFDFFVLS